jgi:DNA replication and repair protein RecF
VAWIARGRSFRRVPDAALVRVGAGAALVRAQIATGSRRTEIAAELATGGRTRVLVNGYPPERRRDLATSLRVTVFTPDDLQLVKGGPAERRAYLDELLGAVTPRYEQARADYRRVLEQRNALLRTGMRGPDAHSTLAVFDRQLVAAGVELVRGRLGLAHRLLAVLDDTYRGLAGTGSVGAAYRADWAEAPLHAGDREDLAHLLGAALERNRQRELERRLTLVGPHRDDWHLTVDGLDARTHASQGEQRSLALALRLAGHFVVRDITGATPVLMLDDVFSELDTARSSALVARIPSGQALLTTAGHVPAGIEPEQVLTLRDHGIARARG